MRIYERNIVHKHLEQLYEQNIYNKPSTYIPYRKEPYTNVHDIKPIAFYLPQYYPTPINNIHWGDGFTEWTNVARALPQYYGHYQPHIPERFGYYDLRNVKIMEEQSCLAKEYGIYGFCFYYYFFQGENQLELPLINYTNNTNIQFPFCLCWANENWTKRWDGKQHEVLLKQTYSPDDIKSFIIKISKYFLHSNYIKVDGKPMLIIYNALEIPNLDYCISVWRAYCQKVGIGDIFLVCAKTFGLKDLNIIEKFDACVEFPPHAIQLQSQVDYSLLINKHFEGKIYCIKNYISTISDNEDYLTFRCAFPSWDNTARTTSRAKIFSDATPETFKLWLQKIINYTQKYPKDRRFMFINAWNEWGEGAHLEPDRKYGYAYLEVLRQCLSIS